MSLKLKHVVTFLKITKYMEGLTLLLKGYKVSIMLIDFETIGEVNGPVYIS